jgi:hypothetical protein
MIKDKVLTKIFEDTARDNNLTVQQVEDIYNSWGLFIRRTITSIDFHSIENEEEYNNISKNFNIPYIGKLYTNWKHLEYIKKQSKIRRDKYERKENS